MRTIGKAYIDPGFLVGPLREALPRGEAVAAAIAPTVPGSARLAIPPRWGKAEIASLRWSSSTIPA